MLPLQETGGGGPENSAASASDVGTAAGLDPRSILTRASRLSAASVLSALLAFPTSLVAARWVGPDAYGRAQLVLLVYFGAVLLRSGAFEGGVREYVHRAALGDEREARRLRDLGFAFDLLLSVGPALLLASAAGLFDDDLRTVGFLLAPLAVLCATTSAYLGAIALAEQRFTSVARTNSVRAVVSVAATLGTISILGPVGLLLGPLVADLSVVGLLLLALGSSRPRLPTSTRSLGRLVRIGLPIGVGTMVYWLYRLTGSTSIAVMGESARLGVYVFALAPVTVAGRALAQVAGVLTPTLWNAMARDPHGQGWRRDGTRVTVVIAVLASLAANLGHAWFGPLVHAFVPGFSSSIPLFGLLAMNVVLLPLAFVPTIVLQSTLVNRQVAGLWIGFAALVVNAAANSIVLVAEAGSMWIAANDVWIQAVVVGTTFAVASPHLDRGRSSRHLLLLLAGLVAWTGAVGVLLHNHVTVTSSVADAVTAGLLRSGLVAAAWVIPLGLLLRSRWMSSAIPPEVQDP